jgi:hypothetical protein
VSEHPPESAFEDAEVVDAVPVLVEVREARPVPSPPPAAQTAVVAVGSFVAGAATAAVVAHQLGKLTGRPRSPLTRRVSRQETLDVLDRRTFLIDVQLLGRRPR